MHLLVNIVDMLLDRADGDMQLFAYFLIEKGPY